MSNQWIQYGIYFVAFLLIQGLIINNIALSIYVYPMVYVIAIMMLPFETNVLLAMGIALIMGFGLDILSDTFGLHTSASLFLAYIRPFILKVLQPRDGYENNKLPTVHDMGYTWFLAYAFVCLILHHTWFFAFEIFRFDLIGLLVLKVIFSSLASFILIFIFQFLFYKPSK
ncbi:rod shape-determining protein MreD [Putridiphycobacter roseus]|uniref:Rod shape-determining protein MreD n=1 Tax=Putridiphycobacter roseus TaxID=2219161 RepID=A0A2W1N2M8_9FLAO|nr:rod shape-determining protein MreD [Putridiphycobacter roseus]PZE18939.1 rod shape-determining protein MreD [Putridiphycobacter roseus]